MTSIIGYYNSNHDDPNFISATDFAFLNYDRELENSKSVSDYQKKLYDFNHPVKQPDSLLRQQRLSYFIEIKIINMAVIIQSPHQRISDKIKQIVQEKFERLEKMYHRIEQYHIVLKKEKSDKQEYCLVEARLSIPGNDLFASEYAESFPVAAEKVSIDLEKQIRKRKTKLSRKTTGRLKV